ncbi:MAG: hypothetical protein HY900_26295 [Deltaproteobacteria bacterium]|nr:hypothetical protein [Deltaproteobacteria bacterium]
MERLDPTAFLPAMELTGLWDPGDVRVLVTPEGSPLARRAPSWAVAYADPPAGVVVLIPTRTPVWPDDGLPDVVRHEVAHILTFRAAGGRMVPRWFDEGLAMAAGRERVIEDDFREALAILTGPRLRFAQVDGLFRGGRSDANRAYSLSSAFFGDLLARHGSAFPSRVLRRMSGGEAFEEAFRSSTGLAFRDETGTFWTSRRSLERWLPLLTSTAAVWLGIVLLSAWAVRVVRARSAARLATWEAEERAALQDEPLESRLAEDGDDVGTEGDEDRKKVEDPPLVH